MGFRAVSKTLYYTNFFEGTTLLSQTVYYPLTLILYSRPIPLFIIFSDFRRERGRFKSKRKETFAAASYRKIHIIAELDGYYATADRSIRLAESFCYRISGPDSFLTGSADINAPDVWIAC
ncbi:hypothetical protein VNO77_18124 [Canavalia gladiata]|uniref:Uncharacterized protein n=1 Tax=Canavalia gladiata TaxID=3824 RepID=A0AAN9LNU7_CANGL